MPLGRTCHLTDSHKPDSFQTVTTTLRSGCPIAASLDLLGDRWTLVVLRDVLFAGHKRFSEFATEERIATNVLAERLERLECAGLLLRRPDPADGRRWLYLPTKKSYALIPMLVDLAVWGVANTDATGGRELASAARKDRDGVVAQLTARAKAAAKER